MKGVRNDMSYSKSREELVEHLKEQLQFMNLSMNSYDAGFESEAKRLATSIRILVHDTEKSTSLLKSLNIKESINYYSYLELQEHAKTIAFVGLSMGFSEEGFRYFPKTGEPKYKMDFNSWWDQPVIINKNTNVHFSRKDIVITVCNKDGGAHIDPTLSDRYARLTRQNGFGWVTYTEDGQDSTVANGPELSIVRQTAFELYLTLFNELNNIN